MVGTVYIVPFVIIYVSSDKFTLLILLILISDKFILATETGQMDTLKQDKRTP